MTILNYMNFGLSFVTNVWLCLKSLELQQTPQNWMLEILAKQIDDKFRLFFLGSSDRKKIERSGTGE